MVAAPSRARPSSLNCVARDRSDGYFEACLLRLELQCVYLKLRKQMFGDIFDFFGKWQNWKSDVILKQFACFKYEIRISSLKSTNVSVCFRGISRLPSAFVFLRLFKLAHISIQVCTFHDGCKQGIEQQFFNRKSISPKITHPQSLFKLNLSPHFTDSMWIRTEVA